MRTLIFIAIFGLLFSVPTLAQKVSVGLHGQFVSPASTYSLSGGQRLLNTLPANITPDNGMGFFLSAGYRFNFGLELGFSGGYVQFEEQTYEETILFFITNTSTASARAVPINFNARYYFLGGFVHPYIGVGGGFLFYESQIEASQLLADDARLQLRDQHGFTVSPQAGIQFDVTDFLAIDLSFSYNKALNGSSSVDVVLYLDENNVDFVPGTEVTDTDTYSIGLGFVFTILSK